MKKTLLLVALFLTGYTYSQTYDWAKHFGNSSQNDFGYSIAVDTARNFYTLGKFGSTVDFDPGPATYSLSSGNGNVFIVKLNESGNFVWARNFPDNATLCQPYAITTDTSLAVYVCGHFGGTADFDPGPGIFNLTASGNRDIFIIKLDSNGSLVWAKKLGSIGFDEAWDIHVGADNHLYITGTFEGTVDFDSGPDTTSCVAGSGSVYVLKLDTAGNFAWVKNLGGAHNADVESISTDDQLNIYIGGGFDDSMDCDPGPGIYQLINKAPGTTLTDAFVIKLDSLGNFVWGRSFGSTGSDGFTNVGPDEFGNVYVTGVLSDTIEMNPLPDLISNGSLDIFLAKLDSAGNTIWAMNVGGTDIDGAWMLDFDSQGTVYVCGSFMDTVDFDFGSGSFELASFSASSESAFIWKLDTAGNFKGAIPFGSLSTQASSICIDNHDGIAMGGWFVGTLDFDPSPAVAPVSSNGANDAFIVKLSQDFSNFGEHFVSDALMVYPNPATREITMVLPSAKKKANVCIINAEGRKVFTSEIAGLETTIPVASLSPGLYFLFCETEGGSVYTAKFLKE